MKKYNVSAAQGMRDAENEQYRLYTWMLSAWTAEERYRYLTVSGWRRVNKQTVHPINGKPAFVVITWRNAAGRTLNQTHALLEQIWLDMETAGCVVRVPLTTLAILGMGVSV